LSKGWAGTNQAERGQKRKWPDPDRVLSIVGKQKGGRRNLQTRERRSGRKKRKKLLKQRKG